MMQHYSLELPDEIAQHLGSGNPFEQVMTMQGKVFRDVSGRKTIQVSLGKNSYFIKQHFGVGWGEILKNLVTFKRPIVGAETEKLAIQKLTEIGIATTPFVAFGQHGRSPASKQSFLITRDLGDIVSLEDLTADWKSKPPTAKFKRKLIIAVAKLARTLHDNGMMHRDFYLCHLCIDKDNLRAVLDNNAEIKLYLIDLHRMLILPGPSVENSIKDIAALYFSSMDLGLSVSDYLRFVRYYGENTPNFWQKVQSRANKLYAKFHGEKFQQRLKAERASLKA